jgi:hypothetical protein
MHKPNCTVLDQLEITGAIPADYRQLCPYHYRENSLGPYCSMYAIRDRNKGQRLHSGIVGVIVYKMPSPNVEMRNIATGGLFSGYGDRRLKLQMVNRNVRCISRVIISPRYRGLGLASWLVRKTLPLVAVPIVESLAVMGKVNPFFQRAGMTPHSAKVSRRIVEMRQALEMIGIEEQTTVDPSATYNQIANLPADQKHFIDSQLKRFLQAYGKRRDMPDNVEKIRFVLSRLGQRPVYYIWFNNKYKIN